MVTFLNPHQMPEKATFKVFQNSGHAQQLKAVTERVHGSGRSRPRPRRQQAGHLSGRALCPLQARAFAFQSSSFSGDWAVSGQPGDGLARKGVDADSQADPGAARQSSESVDPSAVTTERCLKLKDPRLFSSRALPMWNPFRPPRLWLLRGGEVPGPLESAM